MKKKAKLFFLMLIIWAICMFLSLKKSRVRKTENTEEGLLTSNTVSRSKEHPKSFMYFDSVTYIDKTKIKEGGDAFARHKFNQNASDRIGMERTLPDSRHAKCKTVDYPAESLLPTASIIITYHNEARSTLLRTVVSALSRSPDDLVKEVILVDDFSDSREDGEELTAIDKVVLLRNEERQGLIRSRVSGSDIAKGDVLVFLDSHCECNEGWLKPLLYAVRQDRSRIASPVIDIINTDNFYYIPAAANLKGGFDWKLVFKWDYLSYKENLEMTKYPTNPIKTPVIAGGLFAINAEFFKQIGKYDEKMEVWGGENIEISFRVWQCHGSLAIMPCSRVGHVFRTQHPYAFPAGSGVTVLKNTCRVAEVWMDTYKAYFYAAVPSAKMVSYGDISSRLDLKARLNCLNFQWYMDNIYPELKLPDVNDLTIGRISQGGMCLDTLGRSVNEIISLFACHNEGGNQDWSLAKDHSIRHYSTCLSLLDDQEGSVVYLHTCRGSDVKQKWEYVNNHVKYRFRKLCLDSRDHLTHGLRIMPCDASSHTQYWSFDITRVDKPYYY